MKKLLTIFAAALFFACSVVAQSPKLELACTYTHPDDSTIVMDMSNMYMAIKKNQSEVLIMKLKENCNANDVHDETVDGTILDMKIHSKGDDITVVVATTTRLYRMLIKNTNSVSVTTSWEALPAYQDYHTLLVSKTNYGMGYLNSYGDTSAQTRNTRLGVVRFDGAPVAVITVENPNESYQGLLSDGDYHYALFVTPTGVSSGTHIERHHNNSSLSWYVTTLIDLNESAKITDYAFTDSTVTVLIAVNNKIERRIVEKNYNSNHYVSILNRSIVATNYNDQGKFITHGLTMYGDEVVKHDNALTGNLSITATKKFPGNYDYKAFHANELMTGSLFIWSGEYDDDFSSYIRSLKFVMMYNDLAFADSVVVINFLRNRLVGQYQQDNETFIGFGGSASCICDNNNAKAWLFRLKYLPLGVNPIPIAVADGIHVFPNPATDIVNIETPFPIGAIKINDVSGPLRPEFIPIERKKDNEAVIHLGRLGTGVYLITMDTPYGIITKKLEINR